MMNISNQQSGIALIVFLTIIVLGTATFFVSEANNSRFQREISSQKQTARALKQAKDALLGFAAVYAEVHDLQKIQQGFLPCPDNDGDGSSDPPCSNQGKSVLGRFPWRTLGLPILKDGHGECLWYAVSGSYKDNPKNDTSLITSDTNGLFIVENSNGGKIAGAGCTPKSSCLPKETEAQESTQAIAVIFAPGKPLKNQTRTLTSGNATICGSTNSSDNVVQPENYLDNFTINGYTISNYDGTKNPPSSMEDNLGQEELPTKENSVFIKAPVTYDNENLIFNDSLMLITKKDFTPIYERMGFWVAQQVSTCLKDSAGYYYIENFLFKEEGFLEAIGEWKNPADTTYRKTFETEIQNYVNDKVKYCETECDETKIECITECNDIATCETECNDNNTTCKSDIYIENEIMGCNSQEAKNVNIRNSIFVEERLPWAADIEDTSCFTSAHHDDEYKDNCKPLVSKLFGRIPNDSEIATGWPSDCFNSYWWDIWKEKVFYIVNDDYALDRPVYFWVKSARHIWDPAETQTTFDTRKYNTKLATIAKINDLDKTKWDKVPSIPISSSGNNILEVNNDKANKFIVLMSGQRLNSQTRSTDNAKQDIFNYLEDNNYIDFQSYLDNNKCPEILPSTPTCNFERKKLSNNFNDIICKDKKSDCKIPK